MNPISHSKPDISDAEIKAAINSLSSLALNTGTIVEKLENHVKKLTGYKTVLAVSSASNAITLALKTLFPKGGASIGVQSYICRSVYDAICTANCKPVIIDISLYTYSLNPQIAENSKLDAVIVAHMFGIKANIETFIRTGIPVIEDCAQRIPELNCLNKEPKPLFRVYSLEATKLITSGQGGLLLCNDKKLGSRAKYLLSKIKTSDMREPLLNIPYNDLLASIALTQWKRLPTFIDKRLNIAEYYCQTFKNAGISQIIDSAMHRSDTFHFRFILNVKLPAFYINAAAKHHIIFRRPIAPHALHTLFKIKGDFRNSETALKHNLSIPIYPGLNKAQKERVADVLVKVHNKYNE